MFEVVFCVFGIIACYFVCFTTIQIVRAAFCLAILCAMLASVIIAQGSGFLGVTLLLVYIGAIAVFFLITAMTVYRPDSQNKCTHSSSISFINILTVLCIFGVLYSIGKYFYDNNMFGSMQYHGISIEMLGDDLYVHFGLLLQAVAIVLLIAVLGAVVITTEDNSKVVKRDIDVDVKSRVKNYSKNSVLYD